MRGASGASRSLAAVAPRCISVSQPASAAHSRTVSLMASRSRLSAAHASAASSPDCPRAAHFGDTGPGNYSGTRWTVALACSRTAREAGSTVVVVFWVLLDMRFRSGALPFAAPMRFARLHSDCTLRGGSLRVPTLIYRHSYGSCSAVTLALSAVWSLCSSIANRWSRSGCAPTIWLRGELLPACRDPQRRLCLLLFAL